MHPQPITHAEHRKIFGFDLSAERQKILVCGEMDFSFGRDLTAYMQVNDTQVLVPSWLADSHSQYLCRLTAAIDAAGLHMPDESG